MKMAKKLLYFKKITMKRILTIALVGFLAACNNETVSATDAANDTNSTRPRDVNEGVPNNLRIANDSVIVPDTNNQGPNPSAGVDTLGPRQKNENHNRDNNKKEKEDN